MSENAKSRPLPPGLPRAISLGLISTNRVNSFQLRLRLEEALDLACTVQDFCLTPEHLPPGEQTLTLKQLKRIPAGTLLAGAIVARGREEFSIPLTGRMVDDDSCFCHKRELFDWSQPQPLPPPLPACPPLPPPPRPLPGPLLRGQRLSLGGLGTQLKIAIDQQACWLPLAADDQPLDAAPLWQAWQKPGLSWQPAAACSVLDCDLSQLPPELARLLLFIRPQQAGTLTLRLLADWQDCHSYQRALTAADKMPVLLELYRHKEDWKLRLWDEDSGLAQRYGPALRPGVALTLTLT